MINDIMGVFGPSFFYLNISMKLPKIPNEHLTPELREIVGDGDLEFESIVDPMDVMDIQIDPDSYYEDRLHAAKLLVESRNNLNEIQRHHKGGKEDPQDSKETS